MPTPVLEQRKVCKWVDESRREVGLNIERGASTIAAASALLEEAAQGVLHSQTPYMGFYFDLHHTRDEIDPEQYVWELARVARTKVGREYFDKAAALAAQLSITRSQLYSKALDEFIEKYGEALEGYADVSGTASDYWEVSIYTEEEFNAYLDEDELTPELAERYKDLLED